MVPGPRRRALLNSWRFARTLAVALCLLWAAGLGPGAAWAEEPEGAADRAAAAERLRRIEQSAAEAALSQQRLRAATAARAAALLALNQRSVAVAARVQEGEAALSALEAELGRLEAEKATAMAALAEGRRRQGQLLAALERLAVRPRQALALAAPDPLESVRAATLAAATLQALGHGAERLKVDLANLASLTRDSADQRDAVARQGARLALEQMILTGLVAERQVLQRLDERDLQALSGRLAALGGQAADLRDLIQRLDREAEAARLKAEAAPPTAETNAAAAVQNGAAAAVQNGVAAAPTLPRPFADAVGKMLYPAAGRIVRRWGDPDAYGAPTKGVLLQTRWGAEVVAPFDGQIVFAGEFKGYGRILIIQHGGGYHSILTGLDRIDGRPGQWVTAGTPVGRLADAEMQDRPPDGARAATPAANPGGGSAEGPFLYLELRQAGQPVDPQRWLIGRETAK